MKKTLKDGEDFLCSWPGSVSVKKMTTYPMQSQLHSSDILHRNRKIILKFTCKHKWPWIAKAILSKKTNAGGITKPHFRLQSRGNKTGWNWHKNRPVDKWNRTEDTNLYSYIHVIFDKDVKTTHWRRQFL